MGLLETLLTAALVFASTNVDDIVLLSVLFADPKLPARAVVSGQFVGIGALVLVSVLAGLAAVAVPTAWVALLGALPLAIGLYKLIGVIRKRGSSEPRARHADVATLGDRSAIATVAGVTIANGADNLSVYIPLFAANGAAIVVYACVFAVLTGVWCWLGLRLVSNQLVGAKLRRYGHIALPVVLIGIGIHILLGARELLPLVAAARLRAAASFNQSAHIKRRSVQTEERRDSQNDDDQPDDVDDLIHV